MILTCIFIALVILGFILIKIDINLDVEMSGYTMCVIGAICLVSSLILIIGMHATANNVIQKNKIEYEGLHKRYEIIKSEFEDVSKSDAIADITEWNSEVYNTKYWTKNSWTNWFNPKSIADNLEYIPLE